MADHSIFGTAVGRPIAPSFKQQPTIPGQSGGGFELTPAAQKSEGPAPGPLVQSGAGIVPQSPTPAGAPLQSVYENLSPAKREQFEATYRAMFQEGNE